VWFSFEEDHTMGRPRRQQSIELERRWRRFLADQDRSGVSIRGFCEQHGLNEASFYSWRRELARRDALAPDAVPTFVPLQVTASAAIEVMLPTGLVVRVPAGADSDFAVRLVTALRAASC
jgi:hypothetical protein